MTRRLRAVLWAAVSSRPQANEEKDSLPSQLAEGRQYAERMGWSVVASLVIPGESREYIHYHDAAQEIPAYAELERLTDERAFDVLVCRGRDRLGRTDALIATTEAIVARGGAQVLSLAMPHPISDQADRGQLYIAAIERAGAQSELAELRRRHRSGMRGRTLQGKPPNKVPYPYVAGESGEPELPEDRRQVMRRIYELFTVSRRGYGYICRLLNSERVSSPSGQPWGPSTIRRLLGNPFLRGVVVYGQHTRPQDQRIVATSRYPAVFSADEAAVIDEELERRRRLRKGATSPRPWTGIVFCARCGRAMAYHNSYRGHEYYRCSYYIRQRQKGIRDDSCHANYTRLEQIEEAVQATLAYYADDAALDDALARLDADGERQQIERRLEELSAGITRTEVERERLTTAYLRAILRIDEYEERMADLARGLLAQEHECAALRRQLGSLPDMALRKEELREHIPQALEALVAGSDALGWILKATVRGVYCAEGNVVRVELL